jgi:glycosyltransferase involved in cell wall biosynthesis
MIELVIPYYGDPALMRSTVESVLRQDDPDWRLLVVDDCQPGSEIRDWLEALGDPRVKYARNAKRLGISANFQRSLELSSAEHVTFLGCDDVLLRDYVRVVTRAWEQHSDVVAVQPGVRVVDRHGHTSRGVTDRVKSLIAPRPTRDVVLGGERLATSLLRGNWTYFPSISWRRDLVADRSFRPDLATVLDLDLLLSLVLDGGELLVLPDELFCYRRHRTSASAVAARTTERFAEEAQLCAEVAARCHVLGWRRAERAARLHVTSRLHAALLVPGALFARDGAAVRQLLRHASRVEH